MGIATGAGVAAGDLIHTLMAIIGISAIVAASALLFSIIKYAGAAYLIYIGLRMIFDKSASTGSSNALTISAPQAFRQAILAEVLNPKTALFFFAFLPQFVEPANGQVALQLSVFGIIFVMLGLLSTVIFALAAGQLGTILRSNPTVIRWQGKVVGSIYCALGLRLALQDR